MNDKRSIYLWILGNSKIIDKRIQEKSSNVIKSDGIDKSESDEDSDTDVEILHSTSGLFAALALNTGNTDSENE